MISNAINQRPWGVLKVAAAAALLSDLYLGDGYLLSRPRLACLTCLT